MLTTVGQEPNDTEEPETDDEHFGNFRFKSFRKHKLIEEDYSLLNVNDPEEAPPIVVAATFPDERVNKDNIELVTVDHRELLKKEKEETLRQRKKVKDDKALVKSEAKFINKSAKETSKHLKKREKELERMLDRK